MTEHDGSLTALEQADAFVGRHIGPREDDLAAMLEAVGYESLDALMDAAVPEAIRAEIPEDFPESRTERDVLAELAELAGRNRVARSMIGLGYHDTITPPVIQRNILENPGWYTAYTPYQPEISQGRLEALLNFQTMVMDLTGLSCANASLLDEATAAAEAMHMSHGIAKNGSDRFFVSDACLPQTIAVVQTRADAIGIEVEVGDHRAGLPEGPFFGVLLQYPETGGGVPDYRGIVEQAHAQGAIVTVAADLLSLVLLTPPGEFGADIAVGSSQRFGVPLGYGGPHAAYFATHEKYRRAMPGRIVGVSVDSRGRQALRLALQTREQHIRREKATSNICTAQVLLGVIAGMYAVYHGPEGLTRIAQRTHRLTDILAAGLERLGFAIENESWFDTLTVRAPGAAEAILNRAEAAGYNLRPIDGDRLGIACDETTARADIEAVWRAFAGEADPQFDVAALDGEARCGLPKNLARETPFLEHPVFNLYHAETELLRYMRRLEGRDLTLNQAMIPLGSCTMKLNATAEMMPITWPGFGSIHPFAPAAQAAGYRELVAGLERMLSDVTGFAAVSLQPNAGSQGEYAGLLVIRRYHESRGEGGRNVCLIPSSAHGTNPASAVMAGMSVQVVSCDEDGNVDLADLKAKAEAHSQDLAALMITYPSTHGVFEESIVEICEVIHRNGGQVYMDGANLNALLGLSLPGQFGPGRGASQPAQDLLHPPRRRGAGGGPHRRGGASRTLPTGPSTGPRIRPGGRDRPGFGGALGLGRDPADLLGLYRNDGPLRADAGERSRHPQRQLHREAPRGSLPGALHRCEWAGRARMHHRDAPPEAKCWNRGRRCRQAPHGLRLSCADHVLPGRRHADDRADRKRGQGGARSLLRCDDRDPRGDRGDRGGPRGPRRQPAQECPPHHGRHRRYRMGPTRRSAREGWHRRAV